MIRNLKVRMLIGLAALAVGALTPSAASAAQFTVPAGGNTVVTLTPDGTSTQEHHVFDVPGNPSITCEEITGEATVQGTAFNQVTIEKIGYHNCSFNGGVGIAVQMNTCDYNFVAAGSVEVKCPMGKEIEFTGMGCKVTIPSQGALTQITFQNSGAEITASPNVQGIQGQRQGCLQNGAFTTGRYTTGNTLVTGEFDGSQTMKQIQFDA